MPIFGNDDWTVETTIATIIDVIAGCYDAPASSGYADSITVRIKHTLGGTSTTAICALYAYVDYTTLYAGNFIAATEEKTINRPNTIQWETFNFADSRPAVTAGTNYYIVIWGDHDLSIVRGPGALGVNSIYTNEVYNPPNWPSPLTGETVSAYHYFIYCTYSTGGLSLTLNPSVKGGTGRSALLTGGASFGG